MALTKDQIQQYHRDGFLLLPALIDVEALDRFNQRFLDIVDGAEPLQWRYEDHARRHGCQRRCRT